MKNLETLSRDRGESSYFIEAKELTGFLISSDIPNIRGVFQELRGPLEDMIKNNESVKITLGQSQIRVQLGKESFVFALSQHSLNQMRSYSSSKIEDISKKTRVEFNNVEGFIEKVDMVFSDRLEKIFAEHSINIEIMSFMLYSWFEEFVEKVIMGVSNFKQRLHDCLDGRPCSTLGKLQSIVEKKVVSKVQSMTSGEFEKIFNENQDTGFYSITGISPTRKNVQGLYHDLCYLRA